MQFPDIEIHKRSAPSSSTDWTENKCVRALVARSAFARSFLLLLLSLRSTSSLSRASVARSPLTRASVARSPLARASRAPRSLARVARGGSGNSIVVATPDGDGSARVEKTARQNPEPRTPEIRTQN